MATLTLTKDQKSRLVAYLQEQLPLADSEMSPIIDKWRECVDRYEAKTVTKDFPWPGCSNVHVPLVPITIDAIKARIQNAIWAQPDQVFTATPLTEDPIGLGIINPTTLEEMTWRDLCDQLEKYYNYEISPAGTVDFFGFVDRAIDELLLTGTVVASTTWEQTIEQVGETSQPVFDSFLPQVLPSENVRVPSNYPTLSRIPWFSRRYVLRPSEIRQRIDSHEWDKRAIKAFLESNPAPAEISPLNEEQASILMLNISGEFKTGDVWLSETWMRFDLDGNGIERQIVVDHSLKDPNHIFRVIDWPYDNRLLPFFKTTYINRREQFWGMGVAERIENLDEALSASFNQMMDNVTVANTRVWSVNKNTSAMQGLDTIFPGMKVPRDEKDDILPLQCGEVYPSIFEGITLIRDYAERLSKLTDYNLGRESSVLGKQSTATTTLALLQESGQYFDNINRNFRLSFLNPIAQQWLDLLCQYHPAERLRLILGNMADPVIQVLSAFPATILRKRLAVKIAFSNTAATRELARQEEIQKLQALQQYYQGLLSLANLRLANPILAPLVDSIAKDSQFHISRLLDTYGESRTPTSIPPWTQLIAQGAQIAATLPPPTGPIGPNGSSSPSGMESGPEGTPENQGGAPAEPTEETPS